MQKNFMSSNSDSMQIVSKLNSIEAVWNEQFERVPHTEICFSVSNHGTLCLNDVPLDIPVLDVDADSIFVDVEHFGFRTYNADTFDIRVRWPYNGVPSLDAMYRITALHALH